MARKEKKKKDKLLFKNLFLVIYILHKLRIIFR